MHGAFYLDDDMLDGERPGLGGLKARTQAIRETMTTLAERDSARRLARLGGSEPDIDGGAGGVVAFPPRGGAA